MANENEKVEVCRLCGEESRNCFSIFQDKNNIFKKIKICLPINISSDDKLPSNVCRRCSRRLRKSYKLRCTAVEVDKRLRMQLYQKQSDDVYTNKDTNNFSENFLNIKQEIIDEQNVLHDQNDTQEETVNSTEDNEPEIDIVEMKYEDVMEASIEQIDNNSDFVKNKTANNCQRFLEHQTLEQNEQSQHIQNEHKKKYECNQCGKCFNLHNSRSRHVQRKHRNIKCDQCGKCF
ncbi:PREDICTED: gastrula zinc finger protein XlCGF66.1-like, partial [Wasmannia auropunctata]|uniref:gastrula zinc finger protein XlCGF66.1-like n=1 Tax=Wasmannia auropunctata TaxID=64793 RepID=UPI0005F02A7A